MDDKQLPTTISASRIPAVLGFDKRCSRLTLFLRLRGVLEEQDLSANEAVLEGRFYERATADIACHKYGMRIVDGFEQKNLQAGNLSGHPDFLVVDEHGRLAICEVKNPFWSYAGDDGEDSWGEPGTDQVPRAHLIQAMVYQELFHRWWEDNSLKPGPISNEVQTMAGMCYAASGKPAEAADYAYVVARLRGGVERFKVQIDQAILTKVRSEVDMFLERVRLDDPPSPEDEADMRLAWMADNTKRAECNMAMVGTLAQIRDLGDQIRQLEKQRSELKVLVLGQMQDAGILEYVDHATGKRVEVATCKSSREFDKKACWEQHSQLLIEKGYATVDTARLRVEQKSLYEQFMSMPEDVAHQVRQLRLKNKELDALIGAVGAKQ